MFKLKSPPKHESRPMSAWPTMKDYVHDTVNAATQRISRVFSPTAWERDTETDRQLKYQNRVLGFPESDGSKPAVSHLENVIEEVEGVVGPLRPDPSFCRSLSVASSVSRVPIHLRLISREDAIQKKKAKAESLSRFSTISTITTPSSPYHKPRKLQKRGHPDYPHEDFIPAWRQLWSVNRESARRIVAARRPTKFTSYRLSDWSECTFVDGPSRTSSMRTVGRGTSGRSERMDDGDGSSANRLTTWDFLESSVFTHGRRLSIEPPSRQGHDCESEGEIRAREYQVSTSRFR